jgi:N-methylhydantoinase B
MNRGGDGLLREYRFQATARATLITERRQRAPWGLDGGEDGRPGRNELNGAELAAKTSIEVAAGDRLLIRSPGGGGFGRCDSGRSDVTKRLPHC